jgi:hypothetical protein
MVFERQHVRQVEFEHVCVGWPGQAESPGVQSCTEEDDLLASASDCVEQVLVEKNQVRSDKKLRIKVSAPDWSRWTGGLGAAPCSADADKNASARGSSKSLSGRVVSQRRSFARPKAVRPSAVRVGIEVIFFTMALLVSFPAGE